MHNIMEDNPVHISTVKMPTVAAASAEELAIFVAPFDSFIRKISITNDVGLAAADTNYTTLTFKKKGLAGNGTDLIATIAMGPAATGESLVARVPKDVGILDAVHRYIPKGTVVTYVKTETGNGMDITDPMFSVEFVRA